MGLQKLHAVWVAEFYKISFDVAQKTTKEYSFWSSKVSEGGISGPTYSLTSGYLHWDSMTPPFFKIKNQEFFRNAWIRMIECFIYGYTSAFLKFIW